MSEHPFPSEEHLTRVYLQGGLEKVAEHWLTHSYPFIENFIDEKIIKASAAAGKHISCYKGCSSCCHEQVLAQGLEGFIAASWIKKQPRPVRKQILKNLDKWYKEVKKANLSLDLKSPDDVYQQANKYWEANISCPFLERDSCLIYPARPFACRTMLVTSSPSECKKSKGKAVKAGIADFESYVRKGITHSTAHLTQLHREPKHQQILSSASWFPHIIKQTLE